MSRLTLDWLNAVPADEFVSALDGLYEHSPWVMERAAAARPFRTLAALELALVAAVAGSSREEKMALLRAHPELSGKAAIAGTLTADSTTEQARVGLAHCSAEEFARLQALNAQYRARFGWPFIVAVRGPRGTGLCRAEIIDTFARRVRARPENEFAECLRQVHRIAQWRLAERFGVEPVFGVQVLDWAQTLAQHSDALSDVPGQGTTATQAAASSVGSFDGPLTVAYMTPAHRACARQIAQWMRDAGFDEVTIDGLGNVTGHYCGADPAAPWLLTGSHYDTVRNAGRYDGRLGILTAIAAVQALRAQGMRMRMGIEVVAFAEEEGLRFPVSFLCSAALVGRFDMGWLDRVDRDGISLRAVLADAGFDATSAAIGALRRDPAHYLGYVEVHIEQGPVLDELELPLGIVTSINGSVRMQGEVRGQASHAGTTPMDRRYDAAAAVAEIMLAVERRARSQPDLVGTVGVLEVPSGSTNVVPGRCRFSLDLRAPDDARLAALDADVRQEIEAICTRRNVDHALGQTLRIACAPSDARLQAAWERALNALSVPVHRMPSGAGHDAMQIAAVMPQAMLFVRGGNAGISHNPLETVASHDAHLAVLTLLNLLEQCSSGLE